MKLHPFSALHCLMSSGKVIGIYEWTAHFKTFPGYWHFEHYNAQDTFLLNSTVSKSPSAANYSSNSDAID